MKVTKLLDLNRPFRGTAGVARPPKVGDIGVVVHIYANNEAYAVEKSDPQGQTVWIADFLPEELA